MTSVWLLTPSAASVAAVIACIFVKVPRSPGRSRDAWYKALWTEAACRDCEWRSRGWRSAGAMTRHNESHTVDLDLRLGSADLNVTLRAECGGAA